MEIFGSASGHVWQYFKVYVMMKEARPNPKPLHWLTGPWPQCSLHLIISSVEWDKQQTKNVASFNSICCWKRINYNCCSKITNEQMELQLKCAVTYKRLQCSAWNSSNYESFPNSRLKTLFTVCCSISCYTQIPLRYTGCSWYQLCWHLQPKYCICLTQHKTLNKYLPMMLSWQKRECEV